MAQLWGGRFEGQTDAQAWRFNASVFFDIRLIGVDIMGSLAHSDMLCRQGILTEEECESIHKGLNEILSEFYEGDLEPDLTLDEDVHGFVERVLIEKIGEAGKKLHTGRSRNDQVATDMRLYVRDEINSLAWDVEALLRVLHGLMKAHLDTYMPGFTHLQKAQPVTLAHHLGAYFEMFKRDLFRLYDVFERMNYCPLGSGALAGTTYPLDRDAVASALSFTAPCTNSMDAVSDRDYLIELLGALSIIMMHLSRFAEEIILWNSDEYQFVTISDAYATGSSIMPQKKNPDIAELTRGKTGRVYGDLVQMLTVMKSLPLAYNKDMQEDKESVFDAIDTTRDCLNLFAAMLNALSFHKERMSKSAKEGFTNATDLADYLVKKGMPFRDAHEVTGRVVLHCIEKKCAIDALPLEALKGFSDLFEEDVYEAISLESCVKKRLTYGGPSPEAMQRVIDENQALLDALDDIAEEEDA